MVKLTNVLVTGGGGYVGSTLVCDLVDKGYNVRTIDSFIFGDDGISELFKKKSIDFIYGDIRNPKVLENSLDGIDCVIHLAAMTGPLCDLVPKATRQINEIATDKLLELCKKKKVKRFFFASTCSNYGSNLGIVDESTPLNSISLYSETKVNSESKVIKAKDSDFEPCVLRFATVFGLSPKMRFDLLLQQLIQEAVLNHKITIFGPDYWRPLIHVKDISRACILGIESTKNLISGQIYNVGKNDQNFRKLTLAELVKAQVPDTKIEVQKLKKDPRNYQVSFNKIRKNFKFRTEKDIECGIKEMVNAIKNGTIHPKASSSFIRSKLAKKVRVF